MVPTESAVLSGPGPSKSPVIARSPEDGFEAEGGLPAYKPLVLPKAADPRLTFYAIGFSKKEAYWPARILGINEVECADPLRPFIFPDVIPGYQYPIANFESPQRRVTGRRYVRVWRSLFHKENCYEYLPAALMSQTLRIPVLRVALWCPVYESSEEHAAYPGIDEEPNLFMMEKRGQFVDYDLVPRGYCPRCWDKDETKRAQRSFAAMKDIERLSME